MKKLTIGSAVYDDYEGVYFTYQSLRLNNLDIDDELDYVIIDNNPSSVEGKAVKKFCEDSQKIRYFPFEEKTSNSVKNEIFKVAEGKFCMSIDCHILFEPNSIKKLINLFKENPESNDLYHGAMLYDQLEKHGPVTHMEPVWRGNMLGTWACNDKGKNKNSEPFEIPMHGCGIFATRTESWLGFNEKFTGFGGEEGYIHEKYKQDDRKIWCLPFLRWIHRFNRPRGVPYPLIVEERIRNYLIGHKELGLPYDDLIEHFNETQPHISIQNLIDNLDDPDYLTPKPKELKEEKPKEEKPKEEEPVSKNQFIMPQKMTSWQDSVIDFKTPSNFRYLKYEILDSYDGHGALQKFVIEPSTPKSAKVSSFSSESESAKAEGFLRDGESWQSDLSKRGEPHELTIDFQEDIEITKITTFARVGMQAGMPTKFKVYGSKDLTGWYELSNVDVLNQVS